MKPFKRILLAEDDPKDVELTISALNINQLANQIVVVRDGVEVLDYLYRRKKFAQEPDGNPIVILLDLKMPRLDGIQVLKQIKTDEKLRTIPVVILTSSRESQDLETCYQLGANAYVVKPVKFADFIEAVREIGVFWALINEPFPEKAGKT
jgi:CheY-like chemotaxis protein